MALPSLLLHELLLAGNLLWPLLLLLLLLL